MESFPSELGQLTSLRKLLLVLVNTVAGNCVLSHCDLALLSSGITVDLKLHENSLAGTIPPQLGRLTSLSKCRSNSSHSCSCPSPLSSPSPPTLSRWFDRESFVKENNLSGTIPSELGCLTSLGKCPSLAFGRKRA